MFKRLACAALLATTLATMASPAGATHVEPTAPMESLELNLSDADTGTPLDCSTIEEVAFPRVHFEAFVNVASVPSEHWTTRLHVSRDGLQWDLAPYQHQNAGMHGEDETHMKILEGDNNELSLFPLGTPWIVRVKVTGDVSGLVLEEECSFVTVEGDPLASAARDFWAATAAASRAEQTPDFRATVASHTEPMAALTNMKINAGDYPGLNANPAKCDGFSDVFTTNLRIEPKVRLNGVPSEHWDATLELLRELDGDNLPNDLAWTVTWFHQNKGTHQGTDKGWFDIVQANNYDFDQFPGVDKYDIHVVVDGDTGTFFDKHCPFTFAPS